MADANFNRMKSRLHALLLLNDTYSATNSGNVGRFPSGDEIADALLQADNRVCLEIINNPNHPARTKFLTGLSSALTNGSKLPEFQGAVGYVTVSATENGAYVPAILADSKDEIQSVREFSDLFGDAAADSEGLYWIENNYLFTTSPFAKVTYPVLAITNAPQAPDSEEETIIQGAYSSLLGKDGSDTTEQQIAERKFQDGLQLIRSFPRVIPETTQLELSRGK
jgi:hypothetical protein